VPFDVVEKVREVERVVLVEGRIRVGGARATGVSFLFFFSFFWFQPLSLLLYEKEKRIAAQRVDRPENCVDGESVDGEGKSVVRKKRS